MSTRRFLSMARVMSILLPSSRSMVPAWVESLAIALMATLIWRTPCPLTLVLEHYYFLDGCLNDP